MKAPQQIVAATTMIPLLLTLAPLSPSPSSGLYAQAPEITVEPTITVSTGAPLELLVEPHVAVHPRDPDRLIAAAIAYDPAREGVRGSHIDVFVTADGGRSWRSRHLEMIAGADPWLSVDSEGTAFLTYLGRTTDPGSSELRYQVSRDWGDSWGPPMSLGPGHDRETMTSATIGGRNATFLSSSHLRMTSEESGLAHIYLARSVDGGDFETVASLVPNNLQSNTLTTVVTRDGTLILSLVDFATSRFRMLGTRRAWVLASHDLGAVLSEPRFVAEDLAPRTYFVIAADPTDRFAASRLYALRTVGSEQDEGLAILLSYSDDHGETWSGDTVVAGPEAGARPAGWAGNVVVDDRGVVGVAWFDSRHGPAASSVDLYFAASTDGGETFTKARRVTEATSFNATELNGTVANRFQQGGDYFGLTALPGGGFQLLWSDSRTGVYRLYTARIGVGGDD